MILRRVIEHVREQNWTAVGIDLVIMVVGVFLGIQLGNWNAARVEEARAEAVLASLADEVAALRERADYALGYHGRNIDHLQALAVALDQGAMASGDSARVRAAIAEGNTFTPAPGAPATLTQLLSSGQLHLIRDDALRSALLDFKERVDAAPDLFLHIRLEQVEFDELFRHFTLTDAIGDPAQGYELSPAGAFDFDAMRADPEFLPAVRGHRQLQIFYWRWHDGIRQRLAEIDALLGEARR